MSRTVSRPTPARLTPTGVRLTVVRAGAPRPTARWFRGALTLLAAPLLPPRLPAA